MNNILAKKLQKAQQRQVGKIQRLPCYNKVKRDFEIEYQVASELAKARREAKMTQHQVAEAMSTTQSVISRIERGTNVSIETLERYVVACGRHLQVKVV